MRFKDVYNIADLRSIAKARLPKFVFDYIDGGAEDEIALKRNRSAFETVRLVPKYLVDASTRDLSTTLFGDTYAAPFGVAPIGLANLATAGTDRALAQMARDRNIPYMLSTAGTTSIEDAAHIAGPNFWFQLYPPKDLGVREALIKRAAAVGTKVLTVTVDVPLPSKRERDLRNGLTLPLRFRGSHFMEAMAHPGWALPMLRAGTPNFKVLAPYADPNAGTSSLAAFVGSQMSRIFTWQDFDALRALWPHKLVVKGLMSAEDAAMAQEHGADGIILSNHGGRQLDTAPAPIECLASVKDRVGSSLAVLVDSGVRRGSDIAKLIAAGADFVFVGRAMMYGAAAGPKGIGKAFDILAEELSICMGQIGRTTIDEVRQAELMWD